MENSPIKQAVVTESGSLDPNRATERLALFDSDGSPFNSTGLDAVTTGSAIGTTAKTTTADEPEANSLVAIVFTNGNSAETPTINFNGAGARAIKLGGTASAAAKLTLAAGGVALFWFDGTVLNQIGVYS